MKSKDPKKQAPGRYTEQHLETLQKLFLYAWFCEMAELGTVTAETVRVIDTEIEPKARIRRNCIVDLIRDGFLIRPDYIVPRGDKLYRIDEHVLNVVKTPVAVAEGEIELGMCFVRRIVDDVPLSKMLGFFDALATGAVEVFWYEVDGVRFAKLAVVEKPKKVEVPTDEESTAPGLTKIF